MGLYYKTKRIAKLGLLCIATYYMAKSCKNIALGQNIETEPNIKKQYEMRQTIDEKITKENQPTRNRDNFRTLDYKIIQ